MTYNLDIFNKLCEESNQADDNHLLENIPKSVNNIYGTLESKMFIHLVTNCIDLQKANELFEMLKKVQYNSDEDSMIKIMGKKIPIPRKQIAFGEPNTYYKFSGTVVPTYDWNQTDNRINSMVGRELKKLSEYAEQISCCKFNYTLVNNYLDQNNCIGYHQDDEKELGACPTICGISFGQERYIYFKSNITGQVIKILLPHNSMYVMHYPTNKFWKHSIPRTTKQMGQRISLTFRNIS